MNLTTFLNLKKTLPCKNPILRTAGSVMFAGLAACLFSGCASSHVQMGQSTSTSIALAGNNYQLVHAGAEGVSHGFRLLGILPFASPHYADAKQDLYGTVTEPLRGRAIALANEMEDRSTMYFILFSIPKITLTADVIEFTTKEAAK
jgi:hypothetical protein